MADFLPLSAGKVGPNESSANKGFDDFLPASATCRGEKTGMVQDAPQQLPQSQGPVPDRVGVGGRPVTWTGKVVSLEEWRRLSEWERHGSNDRVWNGLTQQWEAAT